MKTYVSGLDLGQTTDPTALAVLDHEWDAKGRALSNVVHLERFPLGTSYTEIVKSIVERFSKPPLRDSALAVDQTGVGRAVVDLLRYDREARYCLQPITITSGHQATRQEDFSWHVPKKDLIGKLLVAMESGRCKIGRRVPYADLLVKELQNFRTKITPAGNEVYSAWREGDTDDLLLAVAMSVWFGESFCVGPSTPSEPPPESLNPFCNAPKGVFISDDFPRPW